MTSGCIGSRTHSSQRGMRSIGTPGSQRRPGRPPCGRSRGRRRPAAPSSHQRPSRRVAAGSTGEAAHDLGVAAPADRVRGRDRDVAGHGRLVFAPADEVHRPGEDPEGGEERSGAVMAGSSQLSRRPAPAAAAIASPRSRGEDRAPTSRSARGERDVAAVDAARRRPPQSPARARPRGKGPRRGRTRSRRASVSNAHFATSTRSARHGYSQSPGADVAPPELVTVPVPAGGRRFGRRPGRRRRAAGTSVGSSPNTLRSASRQPRSRSGARSIADRATALVVHVLAGVQDLLGGGRRSRAERVVDQLPAPRRASQLGDEAHAAEVGPGELVDVRLRHVAGAVVDRLARGEQLERVRGSVSA